MNLHGFGCGVTLEVVRGGAGDPSIIENATKSIKLHGFGGGVGGEGGPRITGNRPQGLGHLSQNARTTPAQPLRSGGLGAADTIPICLFLVGGLF